MILKRLELHDFRNYRDLVFEPGATGVIAVIGDNGQGKTSLLESIGYLSTKGSFRGATKDVIIRYGQDEAVLRGSFESSKGREILVEASMSRTVRDRFLINKQSRSKVSDAAGILPTTVFAAQDIEVIRGAPTLRRELLDIDVAMMYPKGASTISSVEKVLRQRGVLLKQSGGVASSEVSTTLDVWDHQLATYGTRLVELRELLVEELAPYVAEAYRDVSGGAQNELTISYQRSWAGELLEQLAKNRKDDLRRQANTVGPHRDEMVVELDGHSVRHNGSQGEQRTAAYALKVAFHSLYRRETGEDPILLLDDVFSELDSHRSDALLESVSATQTIITTTGSLPQALAPSLKIHVKDGVLIDILSE